MSDHNRSRRPQGRQAWDEPQERRDRPAGGRPRDRRDRDDRDRRRDDDDRGHDQDRRRHRSRSRDRRDRNRSPPRHDDRRDYGRDRPREGGRDRDSDRRARDEPGARYRGGASPPPATRGDRGGMHMYQSLAFRPRDLEMSFCTEEVQSLSIGAAVANTLPQERDRDNNRRRSASPQRSQSPERRSYRDDRGAPLPTRSKGLPEKSMSMSFRVGGPEERGRTRERSYDEEQHRDSFEGTPMDEDRPESGAGDDDDDDVVVEDDDGMAAMQAMMGFGSFGTTKNKKVLGNNVSGVRKEKKTEYRQYMNRQGGFNRPLSPSR